MLITGSCLRKASGEGSLVVNLLTLGVLDSNLPNGRDDSSATGGLRATNTQRRLSGDESDWSAVAARPTAVAHNVEFEVAKQTVARPNDGTPRGAHRPASHA